MEPRPGRAPAPAQASGPGLLVLAVLGFIVLSVVYIESARLSPVAGRIVAELAFLIPIGLSVTGCAIAYTRSHGPERRFWLTGAALNAILLVSELYYLWWIVAVGSPPPGIYTPFLVLHTAGATFFFMLLAAMGRPGEQSSARRARSALDIASAALVVYVVMLRTWVQGALGSVPGVAPWQMLIASVYASWGVLLIVATVWTLVRPGASRRRRWERWVLISLMIYAGGILAWPLWYAVSLTSLPSATERSLLDLVLVLGHYLFTLAAAERILRPAEAWPGHGSPGVVAVRPSVAVTYVAVGVNVIALPAFVWLSILAPAGSYLRVVYGAAAGVVGALMIARTIATSIDDGRLFRRSVTEPVTGLHNHRFFHERLAIEADLAERYGEPLSLLLIDVDEFAALNRIHGSAAGEELLRGVASVLNEAPGRHSIACRLGPDDFGVILPRTGSDAALQAALHVAAAARALRTFGGLPVTLSVGIATYPAHAADAAELVRVAEGTVLWIKTHGKDQVLLYDARIVLDLTVEDRLMSMQSSSRFGTIRALAAAADARQEGARSHAAQVGGLCAVLARRLGLAEERVRLLEDAAQLRDVGMIGLPDSILRKPGSLDADEWAAVRRHPLLTEQIVGSTLPDPALGWLRHHHERWDGSGYPAGLRAVAIPLESRILAVCDAWAAMTSERPWAPALTADQAADELRASAGTQFDPSVVEVFLEQVGNEDAGAA